MKYYKEKNGNGLFVYDETADSEAEHLNEVEITFEEYETLLNDSLKEPKKDG